MNKILIFVSYIRLSAQLSFSFHDDIIVFDIYTSTSCIKVTTMNKSVMYSKKRRLWKIEYNVTDFMRFWFGKSVSTLKQPD